MSLLSITTWNKHVAHLNNTDSDVAIAINNQLGGLLEEQTLSKHDAHFSITNSNGAVTIKKLNESLEEHTLRGINAPASSCNWPTVLCPEKSKEACCLPMSLELSHPTTLLLSVAALLAVHRGQSSGHCLIVAGAHDALRYSSVLALLRELG